MENGFFWGDICRRIPRSYQVNLVISRLVSMHRTATSAEADIIEVIVKVTALQHVTDIADPHLSRFIFGFVYKITLSSGKVRIADHVCAELSIVMCHARLYASILQGPKNGTIKIVAIRQPIV